MIISLTGAGDIEFHRKLLRLTKEDLDSIVQEVAQTLHNSGVKIALMPDNGIPFEVAKAFKARGGTVIATVPKSDTTFGIRHLEPYLEAKIGEQKVFDHVIDTGDWYRQDMVIGLMGHMMLMLGNSLGSLQEVTSAFYLYKLYMGKKKSVVTTKSRIHPDIVAGDEFPFTFIAYEKLLRTKINYEIMQYIEKVGGRHINVTSAQELSETISKRL